VEEEDLTQMEQAQEIQEISDHLLKLEIHVGTMVFEA